MVTKALHSDKETREWIVSDDALPFSQAEYAAHITKTRCTIEERGIDLLIATNPSNLA
jgi:hypothetical protein